ncbi:alginate lyase family protein [Pedobacter sp.]|uniref:alginate lyase family protein n=1 Tax=Pedobacter sp. TaxID=1411316 RepID=UPI003BAD9DE3
MKQYIIYLLFIFQIFTGQLFAKSNDDPYLGAVVTVLRKQVLAEAEWALSQQPITVTAASSSRSAGNKHDFFSEGDYWWPDPQNQQAPYIQKDGLSNPDNFVAHRWAMIRLSRIIGALASAYKITGSIKYVNHAFVHLKAWFVDAQTLMNPNLLYAQAIQGRFTGRGIGIIDTIQLMEVAQGIIVMQDAKTVNRKTLGLIKKWFADYLTWLTTHPYGKDEMNAENNHGTCWTMQVASFARLTENKALLEFCSNRYKTVLLPTQMITDGSFPRETKRTKPYGYSLFNLDAMTMLCQILSDEKENLWTFQLSDGRSIKKGIEYLYPFVVEKSLWPFQKDVMYWDNWPVAQPFLIFGAKQFKNDSWLKTWIKLDHHPQNAEVIRNLPIRNPLIWM